MTSDNEIDFGLGGIWRHEHRPVRPLQRLHRGGPRRAVRFHSVTRDAWDSGGTRYYIFTGSDINFQFGDNLGTGAVSRTAPGGMPDQQLQGQRLFEPDRQRPGAERLGEASTSAIRDIGGSSAITTRSPTPATSSTRSIRSTATPGLSTAASRPGAERLLTTAARDLSPLPTPAPGSPRRASDRTRWARGATSSALTGKYTWNDWTITGALRHEHKEGTVEESFDGAYGRHSLHAAGRLRHRALRRVGGLQHPPAPGGVRLLPLQLHRQQQRRSSFPDPLSEYQSAVPRSRPSTRRRRAISRST